MNRKLILAGTALVLCTVLGADLAMARGGGGGGGGGGRGGGGGSQGGSRGANTRVQRQDRKKKDPKRLEAERERLRQMDFRDRDAGSDRGRA